MIDCSEKLDMFNIKSMHVYGLFSQIHWTLNYKIPGDDNNTMKGLALSDKTIKKNCTVVALYIEYLRYSLWRLQRSKTLIYYLVSIQSVAISGGPFV